MEFLMLEVKNKRLDIGTDICSNLQHTHSLKTHITLQGNFLFDSDLCGTNIIDTR